jgi:hypothetical protein
MAILERQRKGRIHGLGGGGAAERERKEGRREAFDPGAKAATEESVNVKANIIMQRKEFMLRE